jgi:hypothetical protein
MLVKYMVGKDHADFDKIAARVHDDPTITEKAMARNCNRVNEVAERLASPLRYRYVGGRVFKVRGAVTPS